MATKNDLKEGILESVLSRIDDVISVRSKLDRQIGQQALRLKIKPLELIVETIHYAIDSSDMIDQFMNRAENISGPEGDFLTTVGQISEIFLGDIAGMVADHAETPAQLEEIIATFRQKMVDAVSVRLKEDQGHVCANCAHGEPEMPTPN